MSKAYSEEAFSSQVAQDRNWRLKEISDLKSSIRRADAGLQKVLLRALVTLCYAHWEGSIRFAARKYLEHVALRKLQYRELDRQFLRNYFLPRLVPMSGSGLSFAERCALVDDILDASSRRFSRVNDGIISTRANLSFGVFGDICLVCGIPVEQFLDHETFVNIVLLKRRNYIAHGEDTFVGVEDLDEIADHTITLMRAFGDALENHVYLRSFRAA